MRRVGLAAGCVLAVGGCGGEPEPPVTDQPEGNLLTFETGEWVVPPGDTFECFYTDTFTETEISVSGATGHQGPGGHHVLVFYADEPRPVGHHPCSDAEMTNLHQVAGAAGEQNSDSAVLEFRDGMALRIPAGRQLVVQAHYINTSGADMTVNDSVTLQLVNPEDVSDYLSYIVTLDEKFEVPPQAEHTSTTHCEVHKDFKVVLSLGHIHEAGKRYTLEVVDDQDQVLQTIRDDVWQELYTSHPPVDYYPRAEPLLLTKGTRLRQTCSWQNDTVEPLLFPREMCLAFMYYYPEEGDEVIDCVAVP